jgi:hypothetical protein
VSHEQVWDLAVSAIYIGFIVWMLYLHVKGQKRKREMQELIDQLGAYQEDMIRASSYPMPPRGWYPFGSHRDFHGQMEYSPDKGRNGLPLWERHVKADRVDWEGDPEQ